MSIINNLKQFSTSSTGMMAIGIFSTLILSVSYRVFMKPKFDKNQRQEAELVAEYIFQREVQKQSSENGII